MSSWNVILDLCFSICEAGLTQGTPMFLMEQSICKSVSSPDAAFGFIGERGAQEVGFEMSLTLCAG